MIRSGTLTSFHRILIRQPHIRMQSSLLAELPEMKSKSLPKHDNIPTAPDAYTRKPKVEKAVTAPLDLEFIPKVITASLPSSESLFASGTVINKVDEDEDITQSSSHQNDQGRQGGGFLDDLFGESMIKSGKPNHSPAKEVEEFTPIDRPMTEKERNGLVVLGGIILGGMIIGRVSKPKSSLRLDQQTVLQ